MTLDFNRGIVWNGDQQSVDYARNWAQRGVTITLDEPAVL